MYKLRQPTLLGVASAFLLVMGIIMALLAFLINNEFARILFVILCILSISVSISNFVRYRSLKGDGNK